FYLDYFPTRRSSDLLKVKNLKVHFPVKGGVFGRVVDYIKAVDDVSLTLEQGKTYGLVGESGSGKTTTGRAIIGLNEITDGTIHLDRKSTRLNSSHVS